LWKREKRLHNQFFAPVDQRRCHIGTRLPVARRGDSAEAESKLTASSPDLGAFGVGFIAGLKAMTAPATGARASWSGYLPVAGL